MTLAARCRSVAVVCALVGGPRRSLHGWANMAPAISRRCVATALPVLALLASLPSGGERTARACGDEAYEAQGVVVSFAPNRSAVRIAHDVIGGFSRAKTTAFEPRSPDQLQGIDVNARVRFRFTATDEGHLLLDLIVKK